MKIIVTNKVNEFNIFIIEILTDSFIKDVASTVEAASSDHFLGQTKSDNINRITTTTGDFYLVIFSKLDVEM